MPDPEKVTPSRLASPDGQEVGKKHARHASDENTSPAETKPDDRSASPVDETKPDAMGDFDPINIRRDPRWVNRGLREQCFWALGHVVVAFEDKKAFSVDTCGISAVKGIIFWCTRLRTHLAPGLGRVQEELAFDPNSACFSYDVRQAIGRFEEIDRLIDGGTLLLTFPEGFCGVFMEAWEEVTNLEMAIVTIANKAAALRPGALGKVRKLDPHFGKKSVHYHKPAE